MLNIKQSRLQITVIPGGQLVSSQICLVLLQLFWYSCLILFLTSGTSKDWLNVSQCMNLFIYLLPSSIIDEMELFSLSYQLSPTCIFSKSFWSRALLFYIRLIELEPEEDLNLLMKDSVFLKQNTTLSYSSSHGSSHLPLL